MLAFGGDDASRTIYSSAELYDSLTASWKVLVSLPMYLPQLAAMCRIIAQVLINNRIAMSR